jgi:hypothetical protein
MPGEEDRTLALHGGQSRCADGQWLSASVAISIIQGICFEARRARAPAL